MRSPTSRRQTVPAGTDRTRSWFGYVVIVSLLFLLLALYRADYLVLPRVHSYPPLVGSLVLLFAGFVGQALAWHALLRRTEYRVDVRVCIAGMGLSSFTRYIPGKVLSVVGRAAYAAQHLGLPLGKLSMLSLNAQLISLWTGLTLGGTALVALEGTQGWGWIWWSLWGVLSVAVFSDGAHGLATRTLRRVTGREVTLPRVEFASVIVVLPWFVGFWLCWSAGFYLLILALHADDLSPFTGLAFPLATSLGILALPLPGGIGLREGVLAGVLVTAGLDGSHATTYAVVTRLWFLLGEAFMFAVGWVAHRGRQNVVVNPARTPEEVDRSSQP